MFLPLRLPQTISFLTSPLPCYSSAFLGLVCGLQAFSLGHSEGSKARRAKKDSRPGVRRSLIPRVPEALWSHSLPAAEALSAPARFKSEETEEAKVKSLPHAHQAGEWWMSLGAQNGLNAGPELAPQNQEVANPSLGTF